MENKLIEAFSKNAIEVSVMQSCNSTQVLTLRKPSVYCLSIASKVEGKVMSLVLIE